VNKIIDIKTGKPITDHTPKEMEQYQDENGDVFTYLYPDGETTLVKMYMKNLVWGSFNGDVPPGMEITHIDGNKKNNALANLKLVPVTG